MIIMIVLNIVAIPQSIKLEYKPYKQAVYFVWLGNEFRRDWVVISELKKKNSDIGEFSVTWKTVNNDVPPPNDLVTLVERVMFTPYGRKHFAKPPNGIFNIKDGLLVVDAIMDFPVLNRESKTYSIGETIEIPMRISLGLRYDEHLNLIEKSERDVILTQKFISIEEHLGFRCVKIEYGIEYWDGEKVYKTPRYTLKGTLYFAINEGIMIYDRAGANQTNVIIANSKKTTRSHDKTVRLLHYTPLE